MKDVWLQVAGVDRPEGRSTADGRSPEPGEKPTLKPGLPFIGLLGVDLGLACTLCPGTKAAPPEPVPPRGGVRSK